MSSVATRAPARQSTTEVDQYDLRVDVHQANNNAPRRYVAVAFDRAVGSTIRLAGNLIEYIEGGIDSFRIVGKMRERIVEAEGLLPAIEADGLGYLVDVRALHYAKNLEKAARSFLMAGGARPRPLPPPPRDSATLARKSATRAKARKAT
jgi:hypothetical protein